MHYIRLLRAPKLLMTEAGMQTELVFTITTDLGDSFIIPDDPLDLVVTAHVFHPTGDESSCLLSGRGALQWKAGDRVSKPVFELPQMVQNAFMSGDKVEFCVSPSDALSADEVGNILNSSIRDAARGTRGLIMPVWVGMNGPGLDQDISTRRIRLTGHSEPAQYLEIEEEIGESIARHVWDAGVVTLCALVGTYKFPNLETSQHTCMRRVSEIINQEDGVNILELGCGVGILGTGLCNVYPRGIGECTILMTDLGEAAGRASSNMGLLDQQRSGSNLGYAQIIYENLDWEDGQRGRFGRQIQYRRWDLIMLSDCTYNVDMLPALVGTLSALHRLNMEFTADDESFTTKVFLATKPRHPSEAALFVLMSEQDWKITDKQVLSLPVLGGESQSIEMYLFEKS